MQVFKFVHLTIAFEWLQIYTQASNGPIEYGIPIVRRANINGIEACVMEMEATAVPRAPRPETI